MIKEKLLSSLLENVDEHELMIKEVVRNAKQPNETIRIIKKYERRKRKRCLQWWASKKIT